MAARFTHLGQDRPAIAFASKYNCGEMARQMCKYHQHGCSRVHMYFVNTPPCVHFLRRQMPADIEIFSDANLGGCKRPRKSTSWGAIVPGRHCLGTLSNTKNTQTISLAESELIGNAEGTSAGRCMLIRLNDIGIGCLKAQVHMDASAATGIIERQGVCKVGHLDTEVLGLQQQQLRRMICLCHGQGCRR